MRSSSDNLLEGLLASVDASTALVDVDGGEGSVTDSLGSVTPSPEPRAASSSEAVGVVDRCLPLPLFLNLEKGLLNCTLGGAGLEGIRGLCLVRIRLRRPLLGAFTSVSFMETSFSSTGGSFGTSWPACSDISTGTV